MVKGFELTTAELFILYEVYLVCSIEFRLQLLCSCFALKCLVPSTLCCLQDAIQQN
jgi:hypothetical protein